MATGIKLGNQTPTAIYVGSDPVDSIYLGRIRVWGRTAPVEPDSVKLNGQEALNYGYTYNETTERNITVTSTSSWSATNNTSWVLLSATSGSNGDVITLSCLPNTGSTSPRSTTITFTCGEATARLNISQQAKNVTLSVTPTSWSVGYSANREWFDVSSNGKWVADAGGSTWITIQDPGLHEGDYNGFEISVTANDSTSRREGTVIFVSTEDSTKMVNVSISQAGISVPASVAITAKNWYNDTTSQYVNHQSWQVKFIGGSTGQTIHGIKAYVMDTRNGNTISNLVSEQDITVNPNQTVIWGLDDNKINDPSEYQLSYNASDAGYYMLIAAGSDGGNNEMFKQAKF